MSAERFFRALLAARRRAFVALALFLAIAGAFAARVRPSYDAEGFLPTWDARRRVFEEHRATFPEGDRRVALLVAGRLEDPRTHARLTAVADILRAEGLRDVTWIGNVELAEADADDPFTLHAATPFAAPGTPLGERVDDPLLVGQLFGPAGDAFAVHGVLPAERDTPEGQLALEAALEARVAPLRAEGADVRVAGLPILKARGFRLVQSDTGRFLGLGALLVVLLLFVALRRARDVAAIVLSLVPAIVATFGVMGATDTPISALTSFIPLLVWMVGVCDALHLVAEIRRRREEGTPRREAIAGAFAELWRSCLFTSLTTALGFASLALSGVAIVVELALFSALAIALTFVSTMLVLPLLADSGDERPVRHTVGVERAIAAVVDAARAHARRPSRALLALTALLALASIAGATRLRTNGTMIDDVDPAHPLVRDLAWMESHGLGAFSLAIWLRADSPDALRDPELVAWSRRTTEWLRAQAPVRSAVGPAEHLDAAASALSLPPPTTREQTAQLGLLLEMAAPTGLSDTWRPDEAQAQIQASVVDLGSARMGPFFDALEARLVRDPPPPGVRADATGTLRLAHVALADIVSGFGSSLALAALLVFVLLAWMLRSPWQGLLAMIPNALPLFAMLGAMGALGLDVKPSTLLVFSVALGIAVDDTLHLVGRWVERRRRGDDPERAIDEALRSSGRALVLTSGVLGGGFLVLVTSDFQFLVLVGAMTGLAVVVALLGDLFVYPALLRLSTRLTVVPSRAGLKASLAILLTLASAAWATTTSAQDATDTPATDAPSTDAPATDAPSAEVSPATPADAIGFAPTAPATPEDADAIGFAPIEASPPPDAPSPLRITVTGSLDLHLATARTPRVPVARLAAQLGLTHRGEHARLVLGAHVEVDPAAWQLEPDSAAPMRFLLRPLDTYLHVDGGEHAASPVTLSIGFLRLGWGESPLLSPLDLDPRDLRTPGLTPAHRATLSRLATRVTFRHGRHRVEIVGVHEARFDLKPAPFDPFSVFRGPALEALGPLAPLALESDVRWRDTPRPFAARAQQLFARYVLHASRATLALHAASLLDPLGVLPITNVDPSLEPIRLRLEHRRHALLGGSLAVPLGPVVARAELAADLARPIHVRGDTPNAMPIEEHRVLRGLVGARWANARGGLLDVDLSYAHTTARADAPSVWPFAVPSVAARYQHAFLRDRLALELLALATGRRLRGGAFTRAELAYRPHDALRVALGAALYLDGPERSLLDGFGREDRVYLRLEGELDSGAS